MTKKHDIDPDWAKEIEDVEPLKKQESVRISLSDAQVESYDFDDVEEAIPNHMKKQKENIFHNTQNVPNFVEEVFTDIQQGLNIFSARRVSFPVDTFKKLKKGQIAYNKKLDLHGFKEIEAWQYLNDFLHQAFLNEVRCILVVHGKGTGYGDKGDMGVIKANIVKWLIHSPLVLAFHTAQGKHGGSGSLYVLIRKNKHQIKG